MVDLFPIRHRPALSWLCVLAVLYGVIGCAPLEINDGAFSPPHQRYTVHVPEKGWEPMRVDKEDIALWHKQCRAMIAIISSGTEGKGLSVEVVNSHLFIGMKDKRMITKEHVTVCNQDALHTTLECVMDDWQLKVESYSIKAGDTVYDLVYWALPDLFDCARGDFEVVVKS
ncbi:MAG: hypothetical protein AAB331_00475, partial [Planctomycetota bacterium]